MTKRGWRFLYIGLSLLFAIGCYAGSVSAQGKQAVIFMRPALPVSKCDGGTELIYQTVFDLRLNNKDEIRILDMSPGSVISRKDYESSGKNKLVNLYELRWQDDALLASNSQGQRKLLAIPDDMKPQKNASTAAESFYGVMFSGEARDGKQKRKVTLSVREIWKILFIPEKGSVNDALYNHAEAEQSVVLWEAFLKMTGNYRQQESNNKMRDLLIGCAGSAMEQFKNGNYAALDMAKSRAERAQSVRKDADVDKVLTDITDQRKRVNDIKEQVYTLIGSDRFDDAITTADPILIYLSSWEDLNSKYRDALKRSHDLHLFNGKKALEGNQIDVALKECTLAWKRISDSGEARTCFCNAGNRVALRDASSHLQTKQPKQAVEVLEKQLSDTSCPDDEALLKQLKTSRCAYSEDLFAEAKQIVAGGSPAPARPTRGRTPAPAAGNLKVVMAQNKRDFVTARAKLIMAADLCPGEAIKALLDKVSRSISDYLVGEARKADQRNAPGTAYVYLSNAQNYTPESENISVLLRQAREQFEEKTRVSVGVVFENRSGSAAGGPVLEEISNAIGGTAMRAGFAQPLLLDRQQSAVALRTVQAAPAGAIPSPIAIFYGELLSGDIKINYNDRSVRSYYSQENPEWKRRDQQHDAKNEEYKRCRKQAGADCSGLASQVASLRSYRDSIDHYPKYYYDYYERHYYVTGGARMSFRYMDSISRSTRAADTLTSSISDECTARTGVDARDGSARNSECSRIDAGVYLGRMTGDLATQATSRSDTLLRELAPGYYKRAKTSANRHQSIEEFLRFLYLTADKNGTEAEDAKRSIFEFDPDLKADGIFR